MVSIAVACVNMGNVFAQKPLKEIVRENQRLIKKSIRELEKEIKNLESNERKLIADIKKHAKLNQMVRFTVARPCSLSLAMTFSGCREL